jgi:outer membrane protein assembly factor BamD
MVVLASLGAYAQSPSSTENQNTNNNQAQTPSNPPAPAVSTTPPPAASSTPASTAGSAPAPSTSNSQKPAATQKSKTAKKKSKNPQNPIADVDSKQPDKVLFDRAMDAMKHNKYDIARLSLQTLINTYPDSEYIARAKLAIGDSWYQEGGAAAMAQAESEYKDFITFFPNMPEAAEAQLKIANIHYKEMEKADRDPTHARRAEEEYRQLILQFPDSPLLPQAKQRLLEVQEVLADREYMIGHFYFLRESYPAAIARLKSVADTYPLYSGADQALFELGNAYEKEVELIRRSKLPETAKGALLKQYTDGAAAAYARIVTRYPLEERAGDAKKRLAAMKQPVPQATPQAIAEDKAEIASRGSQSHFGKLKDNFHKGPDVTEATKVGEPTLVDPKQASAPEIVRAATSSLMTGLSNLNGSNSVTVERTNNGTPPPENAPVPRSDAAPGATGSATPAPNGVSAAPASPTTSAAANAAPTSGNTSSTAIPELQNDLQPAATSDLTTPPEKAPPQVNDVATSSSSSDSTAQTPAAAGSASGTQAQAAPAANPTSESSSKKKKKKVLGIF